MSKPGYKQGAQADVARQVEAAIERGSPALSRSTTARAERAPAVLLGLLRARMTRECPACGGVGEDAKGKRCKTCRGKGAVGDAEAVSACEAAYQHGISSDDQRASLLAVLIRIDEERVAGELTAAEAIRLTLQTHELIAKLGAAESESAHGVPGRIQIAIQLPPEVAGGDPAGDRLLVESPHAGREQPGGPIAD